MSDTIRSFIAVPLPGELKLRLAGLQDALRPLVKSAAARLSLPAPGNIHITLQFLGDIRPEIVAAIDRQVGERLADVPPFSLEVRGAGAFPNLERPRVVWVGVALSEELKFLQRRVVTGLHGLPIKRDRKPFRPHLTLARVRFSRRRVLAEALKPYLKESFGAIAVDRVILYQSTLKPSGAEYTALATWFLA